MGAPHASGAESDGAAAQSTRSALSPLRLPQYRRLWLASLVSNLGTWMHEAAAAPHRRADARELTGGRRG